MTPADATVAAPVGPIDCETAVRRLWDYLDGRLPALERHEVEAHPVCPPHFAFARTLQHALARADGAPSDAEAESALRSRVRVALRAQAGGNDVDPPGLRST